MPSWPVQIAPDVDSSTLPAQVDKGSMCSKSSHTQSMIHSNKFDSIIDKGQVLGLLVFDFGVTRALGRLHVIFPKCGSSNVITDCKYAAIQWTDRPVVKLADP